MTKAPTKTKRTAVHAGEKPKKATVDVMPRLKRIAQLGGEQGNIAKAIIRDLDNA